VVGNHGADANHRRGGIKILHRKPSGGRLWISDTFFAAPESGCSEPEQPKSPTGHWLSPTEHGRIACVPTLEPTTIAVSRV
jgi:hypothetical protein